MIQTDFTPNWPIEPDNQDFPFGCTYLIHFFTPYHHARHYVGFTHDLLRRIQQHRAGKGSRLLAAVNEAGGEWYVVKVWNDGRGREKYIKRQKNGPRFCPICNPKS
jgi:predicted GIY-YIG superfamily endonuclease